MIFLKTSSLTHLLVPKLLKDILKRCLIDSKTIDGILMIARKFQKILKHLRPTYVLGVDEILKNTLDN